MAPKFIHLDDMYIDANEKITLNESSIEVVSGNKARSGRKSNQSFDASPHHVRQKKALHKVNIGGPKSSFVPIVRITSNEILENGEHPSKSHRGEGSVKDYEKNSPIQTINKKISNVLQGWRNRDEIQSNKKPHGETTECRFRPIMSEDEKHQVTEIKTQPIQLQKKNIRKIPVVEVCLYDDESLGTVSSMGYDGSEHDIEAIFKDAHMFPAYFDSREPDEDVIRGNSVEHFIGHNGDDHGLKINNQENLLYDERENEALEKEIVQDPDLSFAHSTVQKSTLAKDPDISLDGDENIGISVAIDEREKISHTEELYCEDIIDDVNTHPQRDQKFIATASLERNPQNKQNSSPPPLSEISIPVSHDYGYGFYLEPLWNINKKDTKISKTDRIQRVQNLVDEGRKRRKRKDLVKLVRRVRAE